MEKKTNKLPLLAIIAILIGVFLFYWLKISSFGRFRTLSSEKLVSKAREVQQKNLSDAFSNIQNKIKADQDGSDENLLKITSLFATREYLQEVWRSYDLAFIEVAKTKEWKKFVKANYKWDNTCKFSFKNILAIKELNVFCVNNLWNAFILDQKNKDFFLELKSNNLLLFTEESYDELQDFTKNIVEKWEEKTIEDMIEFYGKSILDANSPL